MYVHVCHVCMGTWGGQKRVLDPMQLELQGAMSHLTWVLETKLMSSEKEESSLNYWAHLSGHCNFCFKDWYHSHQSSFLCTVTIKRLCVSLNIGVSWETHIISHSAMWLSESAYIIYRVTVSQGNFSKACAACSWLTWLYIAPSSPSPLEKTTSQSVGCFLCD